MGDQSAARTDQGGEYGEGFEVMLLVAVNVEMVGIRRCYYGDIGMQMMERAIVFVSFDH